MRVIFKLITKQNLKIILCMIYVDLIMVDI